MKVLFAGGGTGGHIVPGRNLAEWLRADDPKQHAVRFLTAGRKVEDSFFEKSPWTRKALFKGYASRPSPLNPWPWWRALRMARKEISTFKPDALILLGGYASLPAALVAKGRGCALYVLEQNALPGRTSRVAAWIGRRIFCHFKDAAGRIGKKAVVTGSPLAPGFGYCDGASREELRRGFGLDPQLKTLLVAGGSQGAQAVNDLMMRSIPLLTKKSGTRLQVLHVAGARDFERVRDRYASSDLHSAVIPFSDPMERAYRAAELILCRGGGMTVAEITAMGLPAVIVPYPHHKDQHQVHNAREMVDAGGAFILEEQKASPEAFARYAEEVLFDPERLAAMSDGASRVGRRDGAERILEIIRSDIREGKD
jgi:UDP-N-acetylglucosamine--N-acetylmuramyl-(pentapeptide) pyrophosphoryl-undecaprenol N-acetylglucosamine transferase